MEAIIQDLEAADLPNEDVQFLSSVIGLENVKKILLRCPGMTFYIPLKMPADYCKRYIEEHFDPQENNVRPMALTLGISERQVWRLLRQKRRPVRAAA